MSHEHRPCSLDGKNAVAFQQRAWARWGAGRHVTVDLHALQLGEYCFCTMRCKHQRVYAATWAVDVAGEGI